MQRPEAGGPQIVVERAGILVVLQDVSGARHRVGGHRDAGGHGFKNGVSECIGLGWEDEDVCLPIGLGQRLACAEAGEVDVRVTRLQFLARRAVADDDLGAGQVEIEEGGQVLLTATRPTVMKIGRGRPKGVSSFVIGRKRRASMPRDQRRRFWKPLADSSCSRLSVATMQTLPAL